MLKMSIEEYEKLVDKVLSGVATPQEVTSFIRSTPLLPLLSKTNLFKNKAVVTVIVTDSNGNPVKGANVMLAGITKMTDDSGKATFEFPVDIPPGFIFIQKDTSINKIPFNGAHTGDKITVVGVLETGFESPMAIGDEIKKIMDTAYKWQILREAQEKIMNPEFAKLPQIGVLRKKSEYEYEIYVPVPVTIEVPPIKYSPQVAPTPPSLPQPPTPPHVTPKPPTPPIPQPPKGYEVKVSILPSGEISIPPNAVNITLAGIDNPLYVVSTIGGLGEYTFHNVPNGRYNIIVTTPLGVFKKQIRVSNSPVSTTITITPPTPKPPTPPPSPVPIPTPPHITPKPPTPPKPPPTPGKATLTPYGFKAKCPESVMEVYKVGRCWNWTHTHTYFPFAQLTGVPVWHVKRIDGKLKGGPSELNDYIKIQLQVKKDGTWDTVATFSIMAYKGEPQPFSAVINADITDVRFVADDNHYVDYSEIEVHGQPSTAIPTPTPPQPVPTPPAPPPQPPTPPQPKTATIKVAVLPFFGSTPVPHPLPRELVGGEYSLIHPPPSHSTSKYILPKVTVYVDGKSKSGSYGTYTFANLEPGSYTVKVVANGRVFTKTVKVNPGETKIINYSIPVIVKPPTPPPTPKPPTPTPPHVTPKPPTPPPSPPKPPTPPPECKEGQIRKRREGNWEITEKCVNGKWVVVKKEPILLHPSTPSPPKPPVTHPPQPITIKPPAPSPPKPPVTQSPVLPAPKPPVALPSSPTTHPVLPKPSPTHPLQPISPSLARPLGGAMMVINVRPASGAMMALTLQTDDITVFVDRKHYKGSFGQYKFSNLSPGTHTVEVLYKGKVIYRKTVTLNPGEVKTITVYVPKEVMKGAIAINVVKGAYAPAVPNLEIRVEGTRLTKRITSYGKVTIPDLEPKSYTITIKDNVSGKTITKTVKVYAGKTAVITYTVEGKPPEGTIIVNVRQGTTPTPSPKPPVIHPPHTT